MDELIKAVLSWRNNWCDQEDIEEEAEGCTCEVCKLIRACDEYIRSLKKQNEKTPQI